MGEWENGRRSQRKLPSIRRDLPFSPSPITSVNLRFLPVLILLTAGCATPETQHVHEQAASPYVSETDNAIKALSAEQVDGYLAGAGMGFAKAAELNSYPGPKHVLELAEELQLTDEQTTQVQAIFDAMQTEAKQLGVTLVEQERVLDALFADQEVNPELLQTQVRSIGATHAELRLSHLNAHLETQALLSDWQVRHYNMVRGYADHGGMHGGGQHQHGM